AAPRLPERAWRGFEPLRLSLPRRRRRKFSRFSNSNMLSKVITIRFNTSLDGFDDAPLREFIKDKKERGDEDHKCEAKHRKYDEPDDQAEWLMISLTASNSRLDEFFGRDRDA